MIDQEEEAKIQYVLQLPPTDIVRSAFNLNLRAGEIAALYGHNWLDDNIINYYMQMILKRSHEKRAANAPGYLKIGVVNTFWYQKLASNGFSSVQRWTRYTNIFDQDVVFVPVHLGAHWCLAVVDVTDKCVNYYDPFHMKNEKCLGLLREFLILEYLDKKQQELDISEWQYKCIADSPIQRNSYDCGVFACITAEYLSRKAPLSFSQEDMSYFRRRMLLQTLVYNNLEC